MSGLVIYSLIMLLVFFLYSTASAKGRIIFDFAFIVANMYGLVMFIKQGNFPLALLAVIVIVMCGLSTKRNLDVVYADKE